MTGKHTARQPATSSGVQLKVVSWRGEFTASEPITDLATASDANGAMLSAFYPAQTSLPIEERLTKAPPKAEYKWWPDGYEPTYYILTQQVCTCIHRRVGGMMNKHLGITAVVRHAKRCPARSGQSAQLTSGVDTPCCRAVSANVVHIKASMRMKQSCPSQEVSEVRPRDGDARIAWLLERRRFRQALAIAETDSTLVLLDFEQARTLSALQCLRFHDIAQVVLSGQRLSPWLLHSCSRRLKL